MLPRTYVNRGGRIRKAFGEKKASRLDSWRPLRPLPPLNCDEAITDYTPRRIPKAPILPKLELDEGELVA
jgi:hypothetical protein